MTATSEYDAYSYAKFLVDVYPEDAIEILCERKPCDIIELVEQRVDRACIKLGGGSKNEVKGMVERRRWDELHARKESGIPATTTTVTYRGADARSVLPATPSSMSSRSPLSQRIPNFEWIYIHHSGDPVQLMARPSGSEEFMIGEDKLEQFQGLAPNWISPSKRITLGGQLIEVAKSIHLTWSRPGEMGTDYQQFWVVDPEMIRHADILLGQKRQKTRRGDDKGAMGSPLSLEPRIPPAAPTPRQHHGLQERSSSTAIYSIQDSPTYGKGRASSRHDMAVSSHHPLRPPGKTATMNSGPPSQPHETHSSHPPSIVDEPLSRPHSASSTRTSKSSKLDTVVVQLCFGTSKRILRLDLTINGDQIMPFLESNISKMSNNQLDRVNHEIKITSLQTSVPESQGSSLREDEFDDDIWGAMVEFMIEHRPKVASKKPEFQLDIG